MASLSSLPEYAGVIETLIALMQIDSSSGNEHALCEAVARLLEKRGFCVARQQVDAGGFNVYATLGTPKLVLQAHLDTVVPYIAPMETADEVRGRGACDTKASAAAMLVAAQQAKASGLTDFGLLFTVGEEVDFRGAIKATEGNKAYAFMVVGEPTGLDIVNAHFGITTLELVAHGKKAHSSRPEEGRNAIDLLVSAVARVREQVAVHPESSMSLVRINGGIADNIIPDEAIALFSIRVAPLDANDYPSLIKDAAGPGFDLRRILFLPAVSCAVPEQLSFIKNTRTVKYGTELCFFKNGVVVGPGDIAYAHTNDERISKKELTLAVAVYAQVLENFCGRK